MNPSYTTQNIVPSAGTGAGQGERTTDQAIAWISLFPAYKENGDYYIIDQAESMTVWHPVAVAKEITNIQRNTRLLGNVKVTYRIFDDLKFNILGGINLQNMERMKFTPQLPAFINNVVTGSQNSSIGVNWITEYTLDYNHSFGNHNVSGLAGFTAQKDWGQSNNFTSNKYPNNLVPTLNAVSGILTGMPQEATLQAFYKIAGGGGSDLCPSDSLLSLKNELFVAEDKRKERSVANGHTNANGVWVPLPVTGLRRSFTLKYTCPVPSGGDSPANFKVIRYADVLLMLAEALNENNKTSEALTYLNMVRTRAGVAQYSGLAKSTTRAKIDLERRLELCFEGHRWFDLLKTGSALEVMGNFGMKPFMVLFPIPLSEIQVVNNPDILWQNPGWD